MSEHTKTPWKVTGKHFFDAPIGGGRLQEVAWCGDVEHGEREANARHIVHCVNNYERLVEALGQMHAIAEFRESRNPEVIAAGELLAALEAEKGGE